MQRFSDFTIESSEGHEFSTYKVLLYQVSEFFRLLFDDIADDTESHVSTFNTETIKRLCRMIENADGIIVDGTFDDHMNIIEALNFYGMKRDLATYISWIESSKHRNDVRYARFLIEIKNKTMVRFIDHPDEKLRGDVLASIPKIKWEESSNVVQILMSSNINPPEEIARAIIYLIKTKTVCVHSDAIKYVLKHIPDDTVERKMTKVAGKDATFVAYEKGAFVEMLIKYY